MIIELSRRYDTPVRSRPLSPLTEASGAITAYIHEEK